MHGSKRIAREAASTAVRETVKLFRSDDATVIEECRRCGKTVESGISTCPSCGCEEIVTYRLE